MIDITSIHGTESKMNCDLLSTVPLVSAVIPAYNAERTIGDTLRSVRGQSYRELEIIVVDDGSTDSTVSIVQLHQSQDRRIILLQQENAGVAAARNSGWQCAKSEFIAFVDADDLWAPTKIEKQLGELLAGGSTMGLVYTGFCLVDGQNRIRCDVVSRPIAGDVLEEALFENFVGHASSPLVRRQALLDVGGYNSGLQYAGAHGCEDLQIYQRIAARYRFGFVPEPLTGYRIVHGGMSSNGLRMLRSFEIVAEENRQLHPEFVDRIDQGVRQYLIFLVGQSVAAFDFKQASHLIAIWAAKHPSDKVRVPIVVLYSKIFWRLQWLRRFAHAPARVIRNRYFPIGEP